MTSNFTIKSFMIYMDDLPTLEKLEKLGKQEGFDRSKIIVIAIKEYVQRHDPGNPQLTFGDDANLCLPKSALETLAKKKPHCSRCPAPATRVYFLENGSHIFSCNRHKLGRQRNVRGFREI